MEHIDKEDLVIVPMEQRHIPTLAQLEKICFSSPWSENAFAQELKNPLAVFFVAELQGEAVGYAGMHHVLDEGDICNIAVFPQHRRKGIACRLLRYLFEYGEGQGLSQIMLEVRASNMGAQALYSGMGFEAVGRRKNFYTAPIEDALLLRKSFSVAE